MNDSKPLHHRSSGIAFWLVLCAGLLLPIGPVRAEGRPQVQGAGEAQGAPSAVVTIQAVPVRLPDRSERSTTVSIVPLDDAQLIDLAQLDIHPLPAPLPPGARSAVGPGPLSGAVGKGNAFMSISPSIVNQNTSNAFGMLTSGWTPGETVQLYVNGAPAGTHGTDGAGRLALFHNTGADTRLALVAIE